ALAAIAAYSYENPEDPFPDIVADGPLFDGDGLGHPLIPKARCVANDVHLGQSVRLLVVSGSNMSGKSTLLRTVGVNAVLALAGAPGRARRAPAAPGGLGGAVGGAGFPVGRGGRLPPGGPRRRGGRRRDPRAAARGVVAGRAVPRDELTRPRAGRRGAAAAAAGGRGAGAGDDARPGAGGPGRAAGAGGAERAFRGRVPRGRHALRLSFAPRRGAAQQ